MGDDKRPRVSDLPKSNEFRYRGYDHDGGQALPALSMGGSVGVDAQDSEDVLTPPIAPPSEALRFEGLRDIPSVPASRGSKSAGKYDR